MDLKFTAKDFEGPLDLLLHLINKHKLDIKDIEISVLVDQYIKQINEFKEYDIDIASEFLDMASRLIYLKTVSLLPKSEEAEELKAELTGELIEYKLCREMAAKLAENTEGFKTTVRTPVKIDIDKSYKRIHDKEILLKYYSDAVGRGMRKLPPPVEAFNGIVQKKIVSVSSKIVLVLRNLKKKSKVSFKSLFSKSESRSDVVATFLAVLELLKDKRIKADEKDGETIITMDKVG
ncbi:MAG: segregation and condensation protein A [Acutalibacteraceae bacterium]